MEDDAKLNKINQELFYLKKRLTQVEQLLSLSKADNRIDRLVLTDRLAHAYLKEHQSRISIRGLAIKLGALNTKRNWESYRRDLTELSTNPKYTLHLLYDRGFKYRSKRKS